MAIDPNAIATAQPYTAQLPGLGGLFFLSRQMDPTGANGLYYRTPQGQLQNLSLGSLFTASGLTNSDLASMLGPAGRYSGANGDVRLFNDLLQQKYGINPDVIPRQNVVDYATITNNGTNIGQLNPNSLADLISGGANKVPMATPTVGGAAAIAAGNVPNNPTGVAAQAANTGTAMNPSLPTSTTPPSGTTGAGIAPPTTNLQPGDTGAAVKQLQDYLVSKGLMTQAQVDTGYGTYGPQTTAAVAALQKSLGVDNSTGMGYFGPRTLAALGGTTGSTTGGTGGTSSPGTVHPDLLTILNDPNLSADQKASIQAIYNAVSTNDTNTAEKIKAAFQAASTYSDPYFKAQIQLATDALSRGLSAKEGDLAFSEGQLRSALASLTSSTAASKDQLSFQHAQELQQLKQKYEQDLQTTQDNLASTGFTNSSRRARAEDILNTNNTGLVESSNKTFGYQTGNLDQNLAEKTASTADQIANLQRLNAEGKLDLLRTGESQVGSQNLQDLGYTGLLGGVGGSIPRQKVTDALSFANSFVL